jgi:DNA-binding HxlR family transcriptional regulator
MSESLACPVESALSVIGGKWKTGILFRLQDGPKRLSELRREMTWISEKVLVRQLQDLVAEGVVSRHDFGTRPPRVEYRLTAYGETLRPVLAAIGGWGARHRDRNPAVPPRV